MQRTVTPELVRAEARLLRLDEAWRKAASELEARWLSKRVQFIAGLSAETQRALLRLEVITADDMRDVERLAPQTAEAPEDGPNDLF